MWAHKESNQSEHKAIKRAQIRCTLSGAIANEELLLEQQLFRGYSAGAARAEEFRDGYEEMNREEQQIEYGFDGSTLANLRKTAQ